MRWMLEYLVCRLDAETCKAQGAPAFSKDAAGAKLGIRISA